MSARVVPAHFWLLFIGLLLNVAACALLPVCHQHVVLALSDIGTLRQAVRQCDGYSSLGLRFSSCFVPALHEKSGSMLNSTSACSASVENATF